jgi:hypothetical protein
MKEASVASQPRTLSFHGLSCLESYRANIVSAEQHVAAVRSLTVDNPVQQRQIAAVLRQNTIRLHFQFFPA